MSTMAASRRNKSVLPEDGLLLGDGWSWLTTHLSQ